MNASFVISAADLKQLPPPIMPEIAFAGRSNVGKSSLINKILGRKDLVKTGKTPGKTRLLNYFNIQDSMFFVDLPGYGYAQVSKAERARWGQLLDKYFKERKNLLLCFILVDIRRDFQEEERMLYNLLLNYNIQPCILLTKADKVSSNQLLNRKTAIAKGLGLDAKQLIHFSAITGVGKDNITGLISEVIGVPWD